jgi:hypothetical protein
VEVKRTKTRQLGTTSRKNTAQVDVTPTEGLAKRSPTPSNDVHRSNGKKPERVPKRKAADVDASASSGTRVQRVSHRGVAKATAGAAAVTSHQTRQRFIPASDDSSRESSRLAQIIALKRAGSTDLKVDPKRTETAVLPDGGEQADGGEQTNGGEQRIGECCLPSLRYKP